VSGGGDFVAALSGRSARTLYNVADAVLAPEPGAPGLDVAPAVERRIRWSGVAAARSLWLLLRALEWQPILTLRERRGFSWLPREERAALLARWEGSRLAPGRRTLIRLHGWIEEAAAEQHAES
jgi:hypothetical protein